MGAVTALGLGKTMEKKLYSVEELTEIGSKQFFGPKLNIQTLVLSFFIIWKRPSVVLKLSSLKIPAKQS